MSQHGSMELREILAGVRPVYQRPNKVSQDIVVKVKTCHLLMTIKRFLKSSLIAPIGDFVIQNVA